MKEKTLIQAKIPAADVAGMNGEDLVLSGKVRYGLIKEDDSSWHLVATLQGELGEMEATELLESEDIVDILQDVLSLDHYFQDETFRAHAESSARNAAVRLLEERGVIYDTISVEAGTYLLQQHAASAGDDLLKVLGQQMREACAHIPAPDHLCIDPPERFIPDEVALESLVQRIYEGAPATAILGPTGSGKSSLARYAMSGFHRQGYAGYIIDANARLEGDRLFDRDDFNAEGTFVLEGVLCRLARETKAAGLKLLVLLEEYNSFTDETRREFYRLFSDEDRYCAIQSAKDGKLLDQVDFSHVQFILTGNPLSSDRYLTDDLKRLSNAEARRMVILHQGYAAEDGEVRDILKSIITKKHSYQRLSEVVPDLEEQLNWNLGTALFKALNQHEDPLGWDIGYSQVADAVWTAALRRHRAEAFAIAITEHILNGIPDIGI